MPQDAEHEPAQELVARRIVHPVTRRVVRAEPGSGEVASPAEALAARAAAMDRAARFEGRLAAVERGAVRRRARRRALGWLRLALAVGVGALVPLIVAAVVAGGRDPSGPVLVAGGVLGGLLLLGVDRLLLVLARRRGSAAWDWHHERYVLIGNPSRDVQEADRPGRPAQGPLGR